MPSVSSPESRPGDPTRGLAFAHGGPVVRGRLRACPEDFVVEEQLGYSASGAGEHVLLRLRKRGRNTQEVAQALARFADVPPVAVSYAGLKDRHAVTTQHFSVQLPGRAAPDWSELEDESLTVLAAERHHRKVRRGALRGNRFMLRITDVDGDRVALEDRLRAIAAAGTPNYFGAQRFGNAGQNLDCVAELFAGRGRRPSRQRRGLLLSAARAQLFNQVAQARVAAGCWDRVMIGDVLTPAGSRGQFLHDPRDPEIALRLARLAVHPTGPLCGRPGRALQPLGDALKLERAALANWSDWIEGLQGMGLDQDRRALRLLVEDLDWQWDGDTLLLGFDLCAGAYATSVLREIVHL